MNIGKFRSLIFSRYRSVREFSDAIGWSRSKVSRFLNGVRELDSDEMREFADFFDLTAEEFIAIFFENQFTKCTI